MVLGQIQQPFYIEPTGYVNTFAMSFFPHGFANFISTPIESLLNKETPIDQVFEHASATELEHKIIAAQDTKHRIEIVEKFLFDKLNDKSTIDKIVKATIDILFNSNGSASIKDIFKDDPSKRRYVERKFRKQIGISPKQLGKVIRFQRALKMLLNNEAESFAALAYENEYYDQAHFIKDFKEFTGTNPKDFLESKNMALSALFYK